MIGQRDRAQAFTLEGFIGSIVLLLAVLFALQAVVIAPTTGGLADRTTQAQLQQEAQDALSVASQDGDLSETVLNWDTEEEEFVEIDEPAAPGQDEQTYSPEGFADQSRLGEILEKRFSDDGWSYNVELVYADGSGGFDSTYLMYQGSAPSDAFTASHTVTLYDDSEYPEGGTVGDGEYPILDTDTDSEEIYNLVEVRVILW